MPFHFWKVAMAMKAGEREHKRHRRDDRHEWRQPDLLRAQAQFQCAAATNWHDGQISKNLSSRSRKNIPLNFQSKSPA
jgi:hypothetical protein